MIKEESRLLPCPFCGGSAEYDSRHYSGRTDHRNITICGHAVYCASVDCIGCPSFSITYDTQDEAIQAWNKREAKHKEGDIL